LPDAPAASLDTPRTFKEKVKLQEFLRKTDQANQ